METMTCINKGCQRKKHARGMCSSHYADWHREANPITITCAWCKESATVTRKTSTFCGKACQGSYASSRVAPKPPKPPKLKVNPEPGPKYDFRGPIARALDNGHWPIVAKEIRKRSVENEHGCWIWGGRIRATKKDGGIGYPYLTVRGRATPAHRLSLQAKLNGTLGQQQAHHTCAVRACVNPDHLQPATAAENIAEMKARKDYVARIEELEAALRESDASHPLLKQCPLGGVSRPSA